MRPLACSCFLLLVLGRLFLPCPHFPPWNLPSFTVEFTLSTPCSRSDPPLSRQGAALAHFNSLMIWYSGQSALLLFLLAKAAPAFLPTALRGTEASLSFSTGPVCSSFSAEVCAILQALCWSRQHQQVCHFSSFFLLSDSNSVFSSDFPLVSNSVADLAGTVFFLLRFHQATLGLGTFVLTGNDAAYELARRGALLAPSATLCSLSPLISRIHSCLFLDWRRTVSSKFFNTQIPSISTEELVLPRHARCVLSRLRCNGYTLLLSSYLTRIGRIENSSCSACGQSSQDISHSHSALSSYELIAPLTLWRLSVSL